MTNKKWTWYKNWTVHNLIAHPVGELLYLAGLGREIGDRMHDATLPPHPDSTGRG
jgi:hypothetical protein